MNTSDIDFGNKHDSEEENEEDKKFGMGKDGLLWQRSTNVFDMAKQRQLAEQQANDFLFNLKQWE